MSTPNANGKVVPQPRQAVSPIKVLLSIGAVAGAAAHVVWPHLKLDGTFVAMAAVAVLPWLGGLFQSVQLPGGLGVTYRDAKQAAADAQGAAASTRRIAETLDARARAEFDVPAEATEADLLALADEYTTTRGSMADGPVRTQAMTAVVGKMIKVMERGAEPDAAELLADTDYGRRLAGCVALYVRPDPQLGDQLLRTVLSTSGQPFVQYWALQALTRLLGQGFELDASDLAGLKDYTENLPPNSDRRYLSNQIIAN